jgi:hypothetical protein
MGPLAADPSHRATSGGLFFLLGFQRTHTTLHATVSRYGFNFFGLF